MVARLWVELDGCDDANLFVLSAENGDCREVFYLGHEPESIAVPPLAVGRYVILAINSGAEDAVLRLLLADFTRAMHDLGAWKIDPMIAFLSADRDVATPFARTLRVLESMPWNEKQAARRLRELGIGAADIRRRGLAGDVDLIRRRLSLRGERRVDYGNLGVNAGGRIEFHQIGFQQHLQTAHVEAAFTDPSQDPLDQVV